jgi:hypothetical protein
MQQIIVSKGGRIYGAFEGRNRRKESHGGYKTNASGEYYCICARNQISGRAQLVVRIMEAFVQVFYIFGGGIPRLQKQGHIRVIQTGRRGEKYYSSAEDNNDRANIQISDNRLIDV